MSARAVLQNVRDILDPGAKKAREDAEALRRAKQAERRADLRWLMADARGRRLIRHELARAGLFADVLRSDPRQTEHAAVLRDHALALWNELLAAAPVESLAMFQADPAYQKHIDALDA